jgi:ABC-2 type transport system ATP-binding protein
MSETAIQAQQLTKYFPGKQAIDRLDLTVPTDSVFGLLGVNGAGKTTLIRMIMGHLHPTAGELTVLGTDPRAHPEAQRRRLAYVSENMELPSHMKPEQAVVFNASAYAQWDTQLAKTLLRDFDLRGAGPFKSLSKGQKRKLCILLAICQNADLLVMDEPAAGLDVVARREFLDQVLDIACQPGRTVLLSSHLLSDLERVVDRLAIIHQGRALLTGSLEDLKAGVRKIHLHTALPEDALRETFDLVRFEQPSPAETVAVVTDFTAEKMSQLAAHHAQAQEAHVVALNLEDIFVELVGRGSTPENLIQESQS